MKVEHALGAIIDGDTDDVRRQQIAGELYTLMFQTQQPCKQMCQCGLAHPGEILYQQMTPGKQTGQGQSSPRGGMAGDTHIEVGDPGETALRDVDPGAIEAWGGINDRDVARSLRELWGKVPVSYRNLVTQYFRDISDLVTEKEAAGEKPSEE